MEVLGNKLKQLSPRFQFTKINWFWFSQEVMNLSSSSFFQVFLFHFKFQAFVLNFWVPWQISLHNGCLETPTSRYEAFWWCLAKTTGVSCVGGWLLATRLGSTIRLSNATLPSPWLSLEIKWPKKFLGLPAKPGKACFRSNNFTFQINNGLLTRHRTLRLSEDLKNCEDFTAMFHRNS